MFHRIWICFVENGSLGNYGHYILRHNKNSSNAEFTLVLTKYPTGICGSEELYQWLMEAILMWAYCQCSADNVEVQLCIAG